MTEERTTGTPPEDDGDAAEQTQTTGTPEGDGRDAGTEDRSTITKEDALALKISREDVNALKREIADLKEQVRQSPAAGPDDEDDDELEDEDPEAMSQDEVAKLEAWAAKGDVLAARELRREKERKRERQERQRDRAERDELRRVIVLRDQLYAIKDEGLQKEVQERFLADAKSRRPKYRDVNDALRDVRLERAEAEVATLRKSADTTRAAVRDGAKPIPRDVSADEHKRRKMTQAEFDKKQEQLRREGRHTERMAMQRQLRSGTIDLAD